MKNTQAMKFLEEAVGFYIHQNLVVPANLYQINHNENYRAQYDHRQQMQEALAMARRALIPEQTRMEI